jgi:D-glycero-alpha-D-manno-heptose-7-phosphate kinase
MAVASGMIVTRTPLRISFAGGGTDLREFYARDHGAVVSSSINRHVYVTVKTHGPVFDERIRLNYSASESVHEVEAIRNHIARECLTLLGVDAPIYISVVSDLPESSGLGGSSSFAVGLLHALHRYLGHEPSPEQLAAEASQVEIDVLKEPIGKQDQYAAAYGGVNLLRFCASEEVEVEPLRPAAGVLEALFEHLLMLWTGHQRRSSSVLTEQRDRTAEHVVHLEVMRGQAYQAARLLAADSFDARAFGQMMDEGWQRKRELASSVSNDRIDEWYQAGRNAGAYGGKLCGAGGGGFLLFVAPPERHHAIATALPRLRRVPVAHEERGSTLLLAAEVAL